MRIPLVLLALVASLALVSVGCGGDDEASDDPTVAWANGFCGAVEAWTDELQTVGDSLGEPSSLSVDALRDSVEDVSAATETFVETVRGLGGPETDAGDEIQSSVQTLADTIEAEKAKIEDAVENADGISGALSAASTVAASLSAMGTSFQAAFTEIGNADASGELESAFEDADSCGEISGSS